MGDGRREMRFGGVTVCYVIAPFLDTPFRFSTCVERTKAGLIHNELGMVQVVQNLIRMRHLNFPVNGVKPHTLYRTPLVWKDAAIASDKSKKKSKKGSDSSDSDSSDSSDSDSDSDDSGGKKYDSDGYSIASDEGGKKKRYDSDGYSIVSQKFDDEDEVPKPEFKYNVMAGPDLFDPKKECVVLFPELISSEIIDVMGDGSAENPSLSLASALGGAAPAGLGGGGGGGGDSESDDGKDGEPEVIFEHKVYDEGEYIGRLEAKLREVLISFNSEADGKDPNAAIFKRIICECFLPWSIKGFKRRPCGILLHGPPGNGKSFLVDSYIREKLGMHFTGLNYASSRFSGGKVGEGERKMRKEASKCFEDRQMLYCMFIDEIDTIGGDRNRKENEGYKTDYLNQLLAIIGQRNYQNLFVIGATNYKDKLDAALVRDGRLENHYYLPSMDKHRRLDHLSRKLGSALTSLVGGGIVISTADVRRVLENNKPVIGYLIRNTINFTFAQFDRLCSDIEGYLRIYFWSRTMGTASLLADWIPEVVENGGFKYGVNGQLVMLARDQMIKTCLDGTVKKAVDNYFKGNSMENLAYNRVALDKSAVSEIVHQFNRVMKVFFERETEYHSGVMPPTGRYIINISTKRSQYPQFIVELARNPTLTNMALFSEKRIPMMNRFFNDNLVAKMVQPLVQARGYEFIQIVDRETVQLSEEDKIYETLKAKYEEASTLAENGTAGLIIIRLNDLVGHIIQLLTTQNTSKTTRKSKEVYKWNEKTKEQQMRNMDEEMERLSFEYQIREALEATLQSSVHMTQENMEHIEERQENNSQAVESKSERATEQERETKSQEQSQRETDTKTERMAEIHLVTHRQQLRQSHDNTTKGSQAHTMEDRESSSKNTDRINEIMDRFEHQMSNTETTTRESNSLTSTQTTRSLDNSSKNDNTVSNTRGRENKNTANNGTETELNNQTTAGFKNDSKVDNSQQNQGIMNLQLQNSGTTQNQNQNGDSTTLTNSTQNSDQRQHIQNNSTVNSVVQQDASYTQVKDDTAVMSQTQNMQSHNLQTTLNNDQTGSSSTTTDIHNSLTYSVNGINNVTDNTGNGYQHNDNNITNDDSNQNSSHTNHVADNYNYDIVNANGLQEKNTTGSSSNDTNGPHNSNQHTLASAPGANFSSANNNTTQDVYGFTHGKLHQITDTNSNSGSHQVATGRTGNTSTQDGSQTVSGPVDNHQHGFNDANTTLNSNMNQTTTNNALTNSDTTSTTQSDQLQQQVSDVNTAGTLNTNSSQQQQSNSLSDMQNQIHTQTDQGTQNKFNTDSQNNVRNAFGGATDTQLLTNRQTQATANQNNNENKDVLTGTDTRTVENKLSNLKQQVHTLKNVQQNSNVEQRTHGVTDTMRSTLSHQMAHSVVNTVSNLFEDVRTQGESQDLSNEAREEGEMSKLLQLVADETVRAALNAEATKLLEQSLNEEYRQTVAKNMTGRSQLQKELKNEQVMNASNNESMTNTDLLEKTLTAVRENIQKYYVKEVNELKTANDNEGRTEKVLKDEVLRPKILDVIGRFAGLSSKYLNSFDSRKGPDILFVVEDDGLMDMLKLAIQWGQMKPSRPTTAMSIPDIFLTKEYDSLLSTFWGDAVSGGKLKNLKVVLTAGDKDKKTGLRPFDFLPSFLSKTVAGKGRVSTHLKKVEIEGSFIITEGVFHSKHAMFLNALQNLTILRITGMSLATTVFHGTKRLKTETIGLACPNLETIEFRGCRLPVRDNSNPAWAATTQNFGIVLPRGFNGLQRPSSSTPDESHDPPETVGMPAHSTASTALMNDFESLLCYLTGAVALKDAVASLPKLKNLGVPYPYPSNVVKNVRHIWDMNVSPSNMVFLTTLRSLDISKHNITWSTLQACIDQIGGTLHTLILDGCVVTDFMDQLPAINDFLETKLPEELRGAARGEGVGARRKVGLTDGAGGDVASVSDNENDYFVNGNRVKPDAIYYILLYWSEAMREEVPRLTFVGY